MPSHKELPAPQFVANNPVGELNCFSITHIPYDAPLYPNQLRISDIEQGGHTGDCYFLSVISAILALPQGEKFIRQQMFEREGLIHVQFFHHENPQWVVIEKSLPNSMGLLSTGPAWVRFLEKAYVVFNGGHYNKVLSSGDSRKVLRAILGDSSMSISTSIQSRKPLAELFGCSIEGCSGKDIYTLIFLLRPYDSKASLGNIIEHVFHKDKQLLVDWWAWVARNGKAWQSLLTQHPILYEEALLDFIDKEKQQSKAPPDEAIEAVKTWLAKWKILPRETRYSQDELYLYEELKQAYESQSPVVVSPKSNPPSGIIMEHTYAVLGVRESQLSHRKFITLRNPYSENRSWFFKLMLAGGRESREWKEVKTGAVHLTINKTHHSTFEMELRDFAHAFVYIDKGQALKTKSELEISNEMTAVYGL